MIFRFDSDTSALQVHAHAQAALLGCVTEDLLKQRWLFFAADGSPLRVDCLADGSRQMRPWASCSSCRLEQLLPWINAVSGPAGLDTMSALRRHLGL